MVNLAIFDMMRKPVPNYYEQSATVLINLNIFNNLYLFMSYPQLIFYTIFLFVIPYLAYTQQRVDGPVIEGYGAVWSIDKPDYDTQTDVSWKVVFDIMNSPEDKTKLNPSIETVARFLNMHAQGGVPKDSMKIAMVVHNLASKDLMTDEAYNRRYNQNNPNAGMVMALHQAGVEIIFCGQSSVSRKIPPKDTLEGIQLGLSAMTALIQFQNDNYRLIKF